MRNTVLPRRVFNSPGLRYANFNTGNHVNLIRLNKPYANGSAYAVYDSTNKHSGLFKTYEKAKERFDLIVGNCLSELTESGYMGNSIY